MPPGPSQETDVAIVGLGPVGATLAHLLAQQGLSVRVLDREAAAYHLPRAVHFDDEVMRVFQSIGLAEAVLPHTRLSPGMRFVDAEGRLLLDWSRPPGVGPQGWNASYRFHQPALEAVLRAALAARPDVAIETGTEVTALAPDRGGVTLATSQGPRRARWLVGCDGARSFVRGVIGGGLEDLGFDERWLVVDVLLRRPREDLGEHSVQFCDPARPATYVRGVGERRRFEITLQAGEAPGDRMPPEAVWALLARWITPEDATLERAAVYTFRSAVARRWRAGRLFVAGDAAHLTPPFLGQGMCAGIRDAANLAWKLARVAAGRAEDALLDSYGAERAPHARAYIETAIRLGGLINTRAMAAALGDAPEDRPARMESIAPALGGFTPPLGRPFAQPRLSDGRGWTTGSATASRCCWRRGSAPRSRPPPWMGSRPAAPCSWRMPRSRRRSRASAPSRRWSGRTATCSPLPWTPPACPASSITCEGDAPMITALGYIGIRASRPDEWDGYATRLLGMQRVDAGGGTRLFRMDDRRQRLIVTPEAEDGLAFLGWEVADGAALDALAARLETAGTRVLRGGAPLAAARHVREVIVFHDPQGNRLEAFHGAEAATDPFAPGRPISGFRTGALGMGHAVLHVADAEALLPFYREVLGFRLSDFGRTPYPLYFFHVNPRHHSFAMVGSGQAGLHHFMVELGCLDDVGQGYDLASLEEGRVAFTLGRHTNDHMTSFCTNSPSGFFVEYGWGGRVIEPATWQPHETFDGPSLWGHERLAMEEPGRTRLRQMRLDAAARGLRAPVQVVDCPWFVRATADA